MRIVKGFPFTTLLKASTQNSIKTQRFNVYKEININSSYYVVK